MEAGQIAKEAAFKLPLGAPEGAGECVMLQKLNENIAECLARAADAQRRAEEATNATAKCEAADMADRWRRLAESYQFVDRIECFLNTKPIGRMRPKQSRE